jgi:CPA1 family monovalent cation:H+ antiporter
VVPLAAALSIPLTTSAGAALPQRDLVLVLAAVVIAATLSVQGFTLEPLARLAGFAPAAGGSADEETLARLRMAEAGLARLDELAQSGTATDEVTDWLRTGLQARLATIRAHTSRSPDARPGRMSERELRGDVIAAENAELTRLFAADAISAVTRRHLQRGLDLEAARLAERQR